ncbi:hypothetical protein B5P46_19245 [Rhizobium leguminosarum]|uniref:Uncharacterized protein n=1 Tax=Rhizobium leguminosarum TaxID=384 RepID=A0A4Q1TY49_RHILE|nr:hypothetical protein B5P46_19245 [Rhizobium leguminosarum]
MRPLTTKSELAKLSFVDISLQLQADASEADSASKTEAATKTAARYEFMEIPHRRHLCESIHSMTADRVRMMR